MTTPVLELDDLSVTYRVGRGADRREIPAVRNLSLVVRPGETLGLAGESGCGKSTVAAAILRLLPDDTDIAGRIELNGEDVTAMSPGRLRAVRWAEASIVFQGALHALNPVQRVGDQVAEAIDLHGSAVRSDDRVRELFEQVGLPAGRERDYPHQLSGGQRQRVLIALALACDPDLLIADEPTTALDVMVQAQVLQLLADLRRERNMAMILITHDLSVLRTSCERLAIMYAGRIVEEGPSAAVFDDPQHPYTRALAAAFPTIGDQRSRMAPRGLGGDPPDPAHLPSGCAFHPRCDVALDSCSTTPVDLVTLPSGRRAACVLATEATP